MRLLKHHQGQGQGQSLPHLLHSRHAQGSGGACPGRPWHVQQQAAQVGEEQGPAVRGVGRGGLCENRPRHDRVTREPTTGGSSSHEAGCNRSSSRSSSPHLTSSMSLIHSLQQHGPQTRGSSPVRLLCEEGVLPGNRLRHCTCTACASCTAGSGAPCAAASGGGGGCASWRGPTLTCCSNMCMWRVLLCWGIR